MNIKTKMWMIVRIRCRQRNSLCFHNHIITMILSSCHHYSLNNDCHGHCHCHCHGHYMQRIYVYFILTCLLLPYLVLSCLVLTGQVLLLLL